MWGVVKENLETRGSISKLVHTVSTRFASEAVKLCEQTDSKEA